MITQLDHVVVGVPDLEAGIAWWTEQSGVGPAVGGPHEGLGTRNALASLGDSLYLEIMSVDPDQSATSPAREWLARLDRPRPFGWCFRCDDAETTHAALGAADVPAARIPMRRTRPDGEEIAWDLVLPAHDFGPVVPFLIDWGTTPSPARGAPTGCRLLAASPRHPDPEKVQALFDAMGLAERVEQGTRSGPLLRFETPRGQLTIEP